MDLDVNNTTATIRSKAQLNICEVEDEQNSFFFYIA
jgi:hypothetical protein